MPSVVVGSNPILSGPEQIISGNPWSGFQYQLPVGGIQLRLDQNASGRAYIYLSGLVISQSGQVMSGPGGVPAQPASGGPTVNSGAMWLSGGALSGGMDGMPLTPGDAYFIPRVAFRVSGQYNVWARADAACSGGFARIYYEVF